MSTEERRYLVSYDISDPYRLRRVFETMKGYGYWLQYSVFVCDLTPRERVRMLGDLAAEIEVREDSIVIVDLGDPEGRGTTAFSFLGKVKSLPERGPRIV